MVKSSKLAPRTMFERKRNSYRVEGVSSHGVPWVAVVMRNDTGEYARCADATPYDPAHLVDGLIEEAIGHEMESRSQNLLMAPVRMWHPAPTAVEWEWEEGRPTKMKFFQVEVFLPPTVEEAKAALSKPWQW